MDLHLMNRISGSDHPGHDDGAGEPHLHFDRVARVWRQGRADRAAPRAPDGTDDASYQEAS